MPVFGAVPVLSLSLFYDPDGIVDWESLQKLCNNLGKSMILTLKYYGMEGQSLIIWIGEGTEHVYVLCIGLSEFYPIVML